MTKEYSSEFVHEIAEILKGCAENKTDNVTLALEVGDGDIIDMNITFSIRKEEK